jgi:hypothetical protein
MGNLAVAQMIDRPIAAVELTHGLPVIFEEARTMKGG